MGQWNINLLKCLIWKHRYVPHCGHTQLYTVTQFNAWMQCLIYADMIILSLFSFKFMGIMAWHMIYSTGAIWQCIKVTPDFNLVFKFSKLRRTPNVTASSKTTYTLIMQRYFAFSLSLYLSLSTHICTHTPSHAYRHDAIFTIGFQSQRQRYYNCQTMHRQVPVSFVCYPQFVIESNHLF